MSGRLRSVIDTTTGGVFLVALFWGLVLLVSQAYKLGPFGAFVGAGLIVLIVLAFVRAAQWRSERTEKRRTHSHSS